MAYAPPLGSEARHLPRPAYPIIKAAWIPLRLRRITLRRKENNLMRLRRKMPPKTEGAYTNSIT